MAERSTQSNQAARRHRRRQRSKMRAGVGKRLLLVLVIAAVVAVSLSLFFRVRTVEVQGNSIYGADAVIEASGIREGDNLLTLNKSAVAGRLTALLPYVQSVRIARILPDCVVIEVTESDAAFAVRSDSGETWLINFSGKVLEQAGEGDYPAITGLTLRDPQPGQPAQSDDTEQLAALNAILAAMDGTGLGEKITAIDVTRTFDLTLQYSDLYEIKLGGTDQMDYKMQYLLAVLDQLSPYQAGTIDLSFEEEKVARFIPW